MNLLEGNALKNTLSIIKHSRRSLWRVRGESKDSKEIKIISAQKWGVTLWLIKRGHKRYIGKGLLARTWLAWLDYI